MKGLFSALFCLLAAGALAQTAPKGFSESRFQPAKNVQIIAFVQQESFMGVQKVWWCAKNLGNDKLEISFTKVVNTTCGGSIRDKADTYLKPGATVTGSTFSGELTFETQVWEEECKGRNKIRSVGYENLVVKNLTEEERKAEEKKAAEEAKQNARNAAASNTNANKSTGAYSNTNSNNRNTSSGQSGYNNNYSQQQNYQAEQQRRAQQQQEQQRQEQIRQQQLAARQAYEQNQRKIEQLAERSKNQAAVADAVLDGIGSILNISEKNRLKREIAEDNEKRRDGLKELEEALKDGTYELVDCKQCNGEGDNSCNLCRSTGKRKCGVCQGMSGKPCTVCNGRGTSGGMNFACTFCFGKGVKQCMMCGNTGESVCITCNGIGRRFCTYCDGTGKKAERITTPTDNNTNSPSSNYNSTNTEREYRATVPPPPVDPKQAMLLRQWKKDSLILTPLMNQPYVNLPEVKTDSAYAIFYERNYEAGEKSPVILKTYVIYRNPDGFYPLMEDIEMSIETEISKDDEGVSQYLGFIPQYTQYKNIMTQIEASAKKQGLPVKKNPKINKLNNYSRKKLTGEDFWNVISL